MKKKHPSNHIDSIISFYKTRLQALELLHEELNSKILSDEVLKLLEQNEQTAELINQRLAEIEHEIIILPSEAKIENLLRENCFLDSLNSTISEKLEIATSENKSLQNRISKLESDIFSLIEEKEEFERQVSNGLEQEELEYEELNQKKLEQELEFLQQIKELKAENESSEVKIKELVNKNMEIESICEDFKEDNENLIETIQKLNKKLEKHSKHKEKLEISIQSQERSIKTLKSKIEKLQREIEFLSKENFSLKENLEEEKLYYKEETKKVEQEAKLEIDSLQKQLKNKYKEKNLILQKEIENLKSQLQSFHNETDLLKKELEEEKTDNTKLKNKISDSDLRSKQETSRLEEELRKLKIAYEKELNGVQNDYNNILERRVREFCEEPSSEIELFNSDSKLLDSFFKENDRKEINIIQKQNFKEEYTNEARTTYLKDLKALEAAYESKISERTKEVATVIKKEYEEIAERLQSKIIFIKKN